MRKPMLLASLLASAAAAMSFASSAFGKLATPSAVNMIQPQASRHYRYSGGPGTAKAKRDAQKRRNVLRNRKAHRG